MCKFFLNKNPEPFSNNLLLCFKNILKNKESRTVLGQHEV